MLVSPRAISWFLAAACVAVVARSAAAQTQYRNLDAGRPGRVEDAEPAARYTLDIDLAAFQVERLSGGTLRYRAEPKLAYGILPFTELEVRLPIVQVTPPSGSGVQSAAGIAGLSVGMLHAFNLETSDVPALAVASEFLLPAGNLGATRGSYIVKGLLTKTTHVARLHVNGGFGTWAVRPPSTAGAACITSTIRLANDTTCTGNAPIMVFDIPCTTLPGTTGRLASLRTQMCAPPPVDSTPPRAPTSGNRWFAGAAVDRSFPFRSLLVSADVYAERLLGLYPIVDWTAEVGMRIQLTPVMVADVGIGRHFAGVIRSTSLAVGMSYELATPSLFGR